MRLAPLLLLAACTTSPATPQPTPAPVIEKPDPYYIPKFLAPDVVAVGTPFTVTLCEPFAPNVKVKANSYLLGTMGHHRRTDCMMLIVPGLNTPGVRLLEAGLHERQILVFDREMLPKR